MPRSVLWSTLVLLVLGATGVAAGPRDGTSPTTEPRLVRVFLGPEQRVEVLLAAGLDVVEGADREATILAWPGDEATLSRLGVRSEVVDEHPGRTAAERTRLEIESQPAPVMKRVRSAVRSDGVYRTEGLPPFGSGSMGGYWTTAEIKMKLDDLVASDANDVVANKIDTVGTTVLGRPIWGLRLGKAIMGPDTRPIVFFNALTHAREPGGMQALFYFVDDLVTRYGTDPFVTYLLDKRVIYIVPLVNPDGYDANEDTYFGGGGFGFWRKNARDNNGNAVFDGGDGVDLNRNFGFKFALNDTGSSASPSSDLYRGPAAFSEPETQSQRNLVMSLQPKTGMSFHTYGDYMLFPWGWTVAPVGHATAFKEWSDELTRENAYLSGPAPAVLYQVNGEFNDWCYGDTISKPRAFTWTPEIGTGSDGFWPPPSRIVPLSRENLRACTFVAAIAGPFVQENGIEIVEGAMNAGHLANLRIRARNLGSNGNAGPGLTGTLTALDAGVHVIIATASYPTLGPLQSGDPASPFRVTVSDTVTPGRLLRFRVAFTAPDGFYSPDTVSIPVGTPTLVASDDASTGMAQWSTTSWGIVSNNPDHPSRFFADSPGGAYGPNIDNPLILNTPLNLSAGVHAYALYESRWEFEQNDDAGSIEASLDGSAYTRIPATGTTPGSGQHLTNQPLNKPLYAGSRQLWKPERADLSAFAGPTATAVRLRFRVLSDGSNQNGLLFDGLNIDSVRIVVYDPAAQPAPVAVGDNVPKTLELAPPWPNPARSRATFSLALPAAGPIRLEILDLQGRRVRTMVNSDLPAKRYVWGWDLRDQTGNAVAPGMYVARLSGANASVARRFVVVD